MRFAAIAAICVVAAGCTRKQVTAPAPPPPPVPVQQEPSKPAARRPVRRPAPAPPAEAAATPPAASVGTMIPAEQRAEYTRQIAFSLTEAERNLASARAKSLPEDRSRAAARVEAFIRQAREAEANHDLITARGLADRARVLSEELVRN